MKNIVLYVSMIALTVLCACTTKDNNEKPIMTPTPEVTCTPEPTNTPGPTPTPSEEQLAEQRAEAYLAGLPTMDWMELECYVDEEASRRCSNLLNVGGLTYDEEGNIYFINEDDHLAGINSGIYVSDYNGDNRRLFCEDAGNWLQIEGDWLYYNSNECGIDRVNILSGEREHLYDSECGEFFCDGEHLVINSPEGVVITDMEGNYIKLLFPKEETGVSNLTPGNGFWLSNGYLSFLIDKDISLYKKGYLIKYDGENVILLNQRGTDPLMVGKYLSVQDPESYLRYVWNIETGEEFTMAVPYTGSVVVSDGKEFYCKKLTYKDVRIYRWKEAELEELVRLDGASAVDYMYLTPKALYYVAQMKENGKFGYHLMYYDLETGETGVIY